jgi:hypothetical protein
LKDGSRVRSVNMAPPPAAATVAKPEDSGVPAATPSAAKQVKS